jgi:hypothetical protein
MAYQYWQWRAVFSCEYLPQPHDHLSDGMISTQAPHLHGVWCDGRKEEVCSEIPRAVRRECMHTFFRTHILIISFCICLIRMRRTARTRITGPSSIASSEDTRTPLRTSRSFSPCLPLLESSILSLPGSRVLATCSGASCTLQATQLASLMDDTLVPSPPMVVSSLLLE